MNTLNVRICINAAGTQSTVFSKNRRAFTLVEMLIVIVLGLIISGSAIGLLVTFMGHYEQNTDLVAARQRGEMVFTLLNGPVLATSLGIPNTSGGFNAVFTSADIPIIRSIGGPLSVTSDDQVLEVVYSVPSGIAAVGEYDLKASITQSVNLTGDPSGKVDENDVSKTDAWVVFPAGSTPCKVTGKDSSSITIEPRQRGTVQFFDEMYLVRAARAMVKGSVFEMEDITRGQLLGQVDGIYSIHFDDTTSGILTAYVLARGNQRSDDYLTPATVDDWPEGILGALPDEARHYRLTVVRSSWRVRN